MGNTPGLIELNLLSGTFHDGRVIQYLGRVLRPAPGNGYAALFEPFMAKLYEVKYPELRK